MRKVTPVPSKRKKSGALVWGHPYGDLIVSLSHTEPTLKSLISSDRWPLGAVTELGPKGARTALWARLLTHSTEDLRSGDRLPPTSPALQKATWLQRLMTCS